MIKRYRDEMIGNLSLIREKIVNLEDLTDARNRINKSLLDEIHQLNKDKKDLKESYYALLKYHKSVLTKIKQMGFKL